MQNERKYYLGYHRHRVKSELVQPVTCQLVLAANLLSEKDEEYQLSFRQQLLLL